MKVPFPCRLFSSLYHNGLCPCNKIHDNNISSGLLPFYFIFVLQATEGKRNSVEQRKDPHQAPQILCIIVLADSKADLIKLYFSGGVL